MILQGIDHIQLAIPAGGEAQGRTFYGELLGLSEIEKPATMVQRGGCWFENSRVIVHLGVQADFVPATKAHPAFLVADLAALQHKLADHGVTITFDEALSHVPRFHTFDPFGNRLEFIQDGAGFSQQD